MRRHKQSSWLDRHSSLINRLSARQYSMGRFLDGLPNRAISFKVLSGLNQATIRSFLVRGYLEQRRSAGENVAYWTKAGTAAVSSFPSQAFDRKPTNKFSTAFSLEMYDRSGNE